VEWIDTAQAPQTTPSPECKWVIVEGGDVFEGTPSNLLECFVEVGAFSKEATRAWAESNGWTVEFRDEIPAEFIEWARKRGEA
jgi:hypothetical protein